MNGGDHVAEELVRQGVRFLFTLCGGHISPILVSAKARGIRVVDVRHEVNAVFAADAVARLSGVPGVAAVTAGPGLTNTLTAIKNAELAQSPLVLLGGATPTVLQGRGALQDIDQRALLAPHVKGFWAVKRVKDLAPAVREAFDVAQKGVPGPVLVECPVDVLFPEELVRGWYRAKTDGKAKGLADAAQRRYLRWHLDRVFAPAGATGVSTRTAPPVPRAASAMVARAAAALARAERPLLVLGSGAMQEPRSAAALAQAVGALGVPVYLAGMARGLLGREHPLQFRHQRKAALKEADVVLLAGFPCDFRLDYGSPIRRSATLIAVNRSRRDLTLNRRPNVAALGDPGRFLIDLATEVQVPAERLAGWLRTLREREAAREAEIERQAGEATELVHPLLLCREIERQLSDDSVLVADGGDFVATASYVLRPRSPLSWLDPGAFGTLGVGAGFALGAKLCRPEAEVWVLYGDGSVGYSLAEMDTFARHGIPVLAVVGNDASWAQIARDQVEILGDDVATTLARTDYHRAAEGFGADGLVVRSNDELPAVLAEARRRIASGRPVLVNAHLARTDFRKGSLSM